MAILAAAGIALLLSLAIWQVQRLAWKTDLIERVESRVTAEAVPAPQPAQWAKVTRQNDEYRRVTVTGRFLNDHTVLTQAVSDLGGGFWVMTPLETANGTYLINRGFVLPEERDSYSRPEGEQTVTGLLRITEPGGGFLRSNDPAEGRWYSRDVAAIAAQQGLENVAPFFIDTERSDGGAPVGGLTVISFNNNHLSYALTWLALALGLAAAAAYVGWHEWRLRRG
ncbi:SURF1 family protein [Falsirhodobacter deserti]|uniref:SURF1 family protein n=1 Tax=Falsirhodobacter deserti TaxID=1365611 RepID=UPI000FE2E2F7|nr:SURF1 family protein [Falsirhodobacter deserti]